MWVVYCDQTGEEQGTYFTMTEAIERAQAFGRTSTWDESFSYRWED